MKELPTNERRPKPFLRRAWLAAACICSAGVYAADDPNRGASERDQPTAALEEILVTATRRETRLEDTPISISALSGAALERDRVLSMRDVAQQIPGLAYLPQSGSETYLSIRGAATIDDSTGTDQGVSMFVDDVVRASVADLQPELYDMERAEVLKGPQGTLFGRNAIGGIVALYTNQPTFETHATGELTGGRFGGGGLGEVKGMLNLPLVAEKLAMRLVVSRRSNSGYIDDVTTHQSLGNQDILSARGKLLYVPSPDWRATIGFDYLTKSGSSPAIVYGNFTPALEPVVYSSSQVSQGSNGKVDQKIWGLTGKMEGNTPIGSVTSITGYRHVYAFDVHSEASDPLDVALLQTTEMDTQLTQELRLASPIDQRFSWVTGLYYLHSNKARPFIVNQQLIPGSFLALIADRPPPFPYILEQGTRTVSYAGFADGTLAFFDTLKLNVGARYTVEDKTGYTYSNPSMNVSGPPISSQYADSWPAFTPKFTLVYQPMRELMTYATVSRGFQSGGFNAQGNTAKALDTPFKPEYVWNYELGTKFESTDRRLQANVSVFEDRYSDLQIIQYNGATLTFTTNNAGAGKVDGVELDTSAAPYDWLTLGVKYDHLKTKFTSYLIDNGPGNPPTINTGHTIPFSAPNQVGVNFELHSHVANVGRLAFGGDYTYRDPMELTAANDTPGAVRSLTAWRGLINLQASWTSDNDRYQISLWGKNVTNIYYATIALEQTIFVETPAEFGNPNNHIFATHPGEPSSYGVTFRVRL